MAIVLKHALEFRSLHLRSLEAVFVSFGEDLSESFSPPPPHPCPRYNRASTADD
ncbi:hypothetical protein H6G97_45330 [Nostoc flagelliforme FACHB-838]|uniref:Uncharacterized protein n=1 Tax=Nostoc flagelliforme FACHB-838 TaxID=2692904 RepID=A0ABR8E3X8_9NOSO|nr:hypothetical protein [Nostoc flagelliforme]MBD2536153.1 hypothetical protein [Nostoc flagelliforme FACHB-838]